MTPTATALLEAARSAVLVQDFTLAAQHLTACLAAADLPEAHELLGGLCYSDEQMGLAQDHWQHAFRGLRDQGRDREAAGVAIRLAGLQTSKLGNHAAGEGWRERARMLLERVGPCVEWGYLELASMACDRTNVTELLASTDNALSIALEFRDVGLETRALADGGLALVSMGRLREGFARLDAALAVISTGEVDAISTGKSFCSMLTACDRAGDMSRAQEWIAIIHQLIGDGGSKPGILHVHCRVVWGSVLCASGQWPEAETQFLQALGPDTHPHFAHRALTIAHLAGLRVQQGRFEEAAHLLEPFEDWVSSCVPLAELHINRGNVDLAAAVLHRGLAELAGDTLRRVQLLGALVSTELLRGDVDAARHAAAEMHDLAEQSELAALTAEATLADARILVTLGDLSAASDAYSATVAALSNGERPYHLGLIRLEHAQLHATAGDAPTAISQARAALACFERLGAASARDRASALLRSLGDTGRSRPQHLGELVSSLTRREAEVLALLQAGLSNGSIAERLFISPKTCEHHVGRILAKLGVRSRAEAAALAVRLEAAGGSTAGSHK